MTDPTEEQIEDLLECGNPTDEEKRLIRMGWDAARNAQAVQAGAVPLTDEQRARIVLLANTVGEAIDMVERAHGIKGGQHAE